MVNEHERRTGQVGVSVDQVVKSRLGRVVVFASAIGGESILGVQDYQLELATLDTLKLTAKLIDTRRLPRSGQISRSLCQLLLSPKVSTPIAVAAFGMRCPSVLRCNSLSINSTLPGVVGNRSKRLQPIIVDSATL